MSQTIAEPTPFQDWQTLFADVQKAVGIPPVRFERRTPTAYGLRDMFVDLEDLLSRVRTSQYSPAVITICADVIRLPESLVIDGYGLILAARRVEMPASGRILLNYRTTKTAKLVVLTSDQTFARPVTVVTSPDPKARPTRLPLGPFDGVGVEITYGTAGPVRNPLAKAPAGMLAPGADLSEALMSTYLFATVLLESQPALATAMLEWVTAATAGAPEAAELAVEAATLLTISRAHASGAKYVPSLSRALYSDQVAAALNAAKAFEEQYERFVDKKQALEARREAAQLMLNHTSPPPSPNGPLKSRRSRTPACC